mmetsp:Transcript_100877/g.311130  ORF Transcript_100877/g.311130 Transcript_100877/m.311130 type:complete len:222 (+) Transcript_100877:65-730(+)
MALELRLSFPEGDAKAPSASHSCAAGWVPKVPRRPVPMLSRLATQPGPGGSPLQRKLVLAGASQFPGAFQFGEDPGTAVHKAPSSRQTVRMRSCPGNACSFARHVVESTWTTGRCAPEAPSPRCGSSGAPAGGVSGVESAPGSPAASYAARDSSRSPLARSASAGSVGAAGSPAAGARESGPGPRSGFAGARSPVHWRRSQLRPAYAGSTYSNRIRALQTQ